MASSGGAIRLGVLRLDELVGRQLKLGHLIRRDRRGSIGIEIYLDQLFIVAVGSWWHAAGGVRLERIIASG